MIKKMKRVAQILMGTFEEHDYPIKADFYGDFNFVVHYDSVSGQVTSYVEALGSEGNAIMKFWVGKVLETGSLDKEIQDILDTYKGEYK